MNVCLESAGPADLLSPLHADDAPYGELVVASRRRCGSGRRRATCRRWQPRVRTTETRLLKSGALDEWVALFTDDLLY